MRSQENSTECAGSIASDCNGQEPTSTLTPEGTLGSIYSVRMVFLLAVVCNLILAVSLPTPARLDGFGTEAGQLAASIARGQGFSSPYGERTGPSAWLPPIYPLVLAGIFRVFGIFTLSAYRVAIAFNIVIHAITCALLYRAAAQVFGRRVGFFSALALAGFPLLFYPLLPMHLLPGNAGASKGLFILPNNIGYTYLTELAVILLIWYTLNSPHWAVYGITCGVGALISPSILALAPALGAYLVLRRTSRRYLALAICMACLCVSPWWIRNYRVFHHWVPIRDNFGVELRAGNQPGSGGLWDSTVHPGENPIELNRMVTMGEAAYTTMAGRDAFDIIRVHRAEFLHNTIRRVGYWWIGTPSKWHGRFRFLAHAPLAAFSLLAFCGVVYAVRGRNRGALLFAAVLLFYPIVYYVTHTFSLAYMYPIQPEMLALAVSVVRRSR